MAHSARSRLPGRRRGGLAAWPLWARQIETRAARVTVAATPSVAPSSNLQADGQESRARVPGAISRAAQEPAGAILRGAVRREAVPASRNSGQPWQAR